MDACHSEWPKYVCDICNKSYKWEASFRQHMRSHHALKTENEDMDRKENNDYADEEGAYQQMSQQNEGNGAQNYENMDDGDKGAEYDNDGANNRDESGLNESGNDLQENQINEHDEEDIDIDSQEKDIEQQINQSQNEPRMAAYHDNEQMGAAGALASIAESCYMMNNRA